MIWLIKNKGMKGQLSQLVLPIFIETALVMMLGAVDTVMLSQHSDNAVAAVGVVNQLVNLAVLVFQVISFGTTVLCSQYLGAGWKERMVQATGVAIVLNAVTGVLVSAVLYSGCTWMLQLMGLRPDLLGEGVSYMRIVGAFAFFQAISLAISASLRSADKAIYPMLVTVVVNILNILGNYTLIFGKFGMHALGVEGAAISTSIARGVSMVILFVLLFRKHIPAFPRRLFRPFPWIELKNLLKIGIPAAGEEISYSGSQVVITFFINLLGNAALATRTYCWNMIFFVYIFSIAMGQGGAILIGHLVGEKRITAAYLLGCYTRRLAIIVSVILSVLLALSGGTILGWLTENPDIICMGKIILWIDVVLEVGRAINIWATQALRATGDVNYQFYVGITVQWLVSVGFSYLLGLHWGFGLIGMWVSFMLDENIRGLIFIYRWRSKKWATKGFVKDSCTEVCQPCSQVTPSVQPS